MLEHEHTYLFLFFISVISKQLMRLNCVLYFFSFLQGTNKKVFEINKISDG